MMVRGVRGATTVAENRAEAIVDAAAELLAEMIEANGIVEDEVASVIFTSTPDLDAGFPAPAGRKVGWSRVALLGMQELSVPGATERTVRILIHWNTEKGLDDLVHVYLHGAQSLRPDLTQRRQALQGETVGGDREGDRS